MITTDIHEVLYEIIGDVLEHYEDAHHELRCIGQRQYPTELRVWVAVLGAKPDVMVRVWWLDQFFWYVTDLRTGRDVALSARQQDADTRYTGRGWRDRLRADVLSALFDAIEGLE